MKLESNRKTLTVLCTSIALVGTMRSLPAQQAGLLVLEAPASTEAMAYGNTPYLFSRESGMLFYAPALLSRTSGATAGLQLYGSAGTMATLSGASSWQGGGLAIGLQYMRYGSDLGSPVARDSQSVALRSGTVGATELVGSIGYGHQVFGLETGLVLKYVEHALNQGGDRTVVFDVGVATDIGPVMVNVVAQNLGSDLDVVYDPCPTCVVAPPRVRTILELPRQLSADLSLDDFQVGPLDMFVTARTTWRRDGQFIPAGGVELSYWPLTGYTFRLRGGIERVVEDERSPFTFGAAFTGDNITLEYAFQGFDGSGNAHRFGLRWR